MSAAEKSCMTCKYRDRPEEELCYSCQWDSTIDDPLPEWTPADAPQSTQVPDPYQEPPGAELCASDPLRREITSAAPKPREPKP